MANRISSQVDLAPFAITQLDSGLINQPVQQLSIKEQLLQIPGVYVQNANNFAQDARISIRGFGANAAFGIRGIKLIVDGIPETTPDGTGQLDNLNLDQIGRIRVLRGASSSLYGNASGGTILINSTTVTKNNLVFQSMFGSYGFQSMFESYGFQSQSISGGVKNERATYQANVRYFKQDGYRDNSSFKQVNARFATRQELSDKLSAAFIAEYVNSPEAQDAGGLTLEETETGFRQARDRNLTFAAGESIEQWKVGTSLLWSLTDKIDLTTYTFFNRRNFEGKLPFENSGIIDLERDYFGVGNSINLKAGLHIIKAGYDVLFQSDNRLRFNNLNGVQGDLVFDQQESFLNSGFYVLDEITWRDWTLSSGIRFDLNRLEVNDQFISNGDDSGSINMDNWSYQVGVGKSLIKDLQWFASFATSFETPTLIQLSNRPDNSGGFEDLEAAKANTFESGIRWRKNRFNIEMVGFITRTKEELVPYELEDFPDRTFFRNAGKTSRRGLEFATSYQSPVVSVYTSYTVSNFTFDEYEENGTTLDGFDLPGTPNQFGSINVSIRPIPDLSISLPVQYVGSLKANNQNTVSIDDYVEVSAMIDYQFNVASLMIKPFAGVRNLTNQRYFDNIRINAFGSRYYEPAPRVNWYMGLKMKI